MAKHKFRVGDRVTAKVPVPAYYSGGRLVIPPYRLPIVNFGPGMIGIVKSIAPKVRIEKGEGKDGADEFLVVDFHSEATGKEERVGLNFCNAKRIG